MSFEAGTRRRPARPHECWEFNGVRGFLIARDPAADLRTVESGLSADAAAAAQELSEALPTLLREGRLRAELDEIPVIFGAIAIDTAGRLASATSTSGTPYKPPGRVGDSATFGAGGYAQANVAAVGTTGHGEQIYRTLLAKYASDCVALGMTAHDAAQAAAQHFEERFPASMSGVIVIDHDGRFSASQTAPKLAHGWMTETSQPHTAMRSET